MTEKQPNESVETFYKCKAQVDISYKVFAKANKELLVRGRFIHGLPNDLKMAVLIRKMENRKWESKKQYWLRLRGPLFGIHAPILRYK